jgi:hypothetical protein
LRSRRTRIPNFDRPVLKASLEKRLGLVNVLATILAIALATVPDGDALNLTCALELLAFTKMEFQSRSRCVCRRPPRTHAASDAHHPRKALPTKRREWRVWRRWSVKGVRNVCSFTR